MNAAMSLASHRLYRPDLSHVGNGERLVLHSGRVRGQGRVGLDQLLTYRPVPHRAELAVASHHHRGGQARVVLQFPVEAVELHGRDRVGTALADLRQEVRNGSCPRPSWLSSVTSPSTGRFARPAWAQLASCHSRGELRHRAARTPPPVEVSGQTLPPRSAQPGGRRPAWRRPGCRARGRCRRRSDAGPCRNPRQPRPANRHAPPGTAWSLASPNYVGRTVGRASSTLPVSPSATF